MPITPNYRIICSNKEGATKFQVFLTHINAREESKIDNLDNNILELVRGNKTFKILYKNIYCYGDVDFTNDEDLDTIDDFNFLNHLSAVGISLPSDYDYDKHECRPNGTRIKYRESWSPSEVVMYNYACLGKPKKILLFKQIIK